MKQKIVFLITFLLILNAFVLKGQGWDYTYPIEVGRTVQTDANALAEAPNGDFIALENSVEGPKLMRIDKDGHFIWQKQYSFGTNGMNGKISVVCSQDGSIFVHGAGNFQGNSAQTYLLKTNARGDSIFLKKSENGYLNYQMIATSDNNLVVVEDTKYGSSHVVKLNSTADTVWKKTFNAALFANITETRDENLVLLYGQNPSKMDKFSPNGNLIWSKEVFGYFGYSIAGTTDNGIVCMVENKINNIIIGELAKFNAAGNFEWRTTKPYFIHQYSKLVPTDDNGVVCLSFRNYAKFDNQGNEVWARANRFLTPARSILKTSDNGFLIGGTAPMGTFQSMARLIKTNQEGSAFSNTLIGRVFKINDCNTPDTTSQIVKNWFVKAQKANGNTFWGLTDSLGRYRIEMDSTAFDLSLITPNSLWQTCSPFIRVLTQPQDSIINIDLTTSPKNDCHYMLISMTTPLVRRCMSNDYTVKYCNNGTIAAQNVRVEIKLDSLLEYISATRPLSNRSGQKLIFNIGNMAALDCGDFKITTRTRCGDSTRLGQSLCTEARIFPDTICVPAPNWSGANIVVNGRCDRDSVRFLIQNIGTATSAPLRRKIVEDEIVFLNGLIIVPANGSQTISVPANGKTWQLLMEQEPNNPLSNRPTAVVEGCRLNQNQPISTGFVNQFPTDDGSPTIDNVCAQIVGSYDPNDKEGLPLGYKSAHFIDQNQDIEYRIRFQNTGTDTAFTIVVRDTLSDFLDIASLKIGASSHRFNWTIDGKNVLVFRFENILLPDSFRNEVASHGFVKFKISQKKDVALGTKIMNQADIYFDFNESIRTNKTVHTIGKDFIINALQTISTIPNVKIKVYPNPFNAEATIEIQGFDKIIPLSKTNNFELFDALGRQIRSEKFEGNQFLFERQELPTGIYFFKIENGGRLVGTGKFLVR